MPKCKTSRVTAHKEPGLRTESIIILRKGKCMFLLGCLFVLILVCSLIIRSAFFSTSEPSSLSVGGAPLGLSIAILGAAQGDLRPRPDSSTHDPGT